MAFLLLFFVIATVLPRAKIERKHDRMPTRFLLRCGNGRGRNTLALLLVLFSKFI